jgi:nitrite reductase/ring-hydroxylating ferredoxin subunit
MSLPPETESKSSDCDGCPLTGRRDFLRDALAATAGVIAALAIPRELAALPFAFTDAVARAGSTRAYSIPPADSVQIDKDEEVIVVRWQNAVYAFALSCPHQSTALRWQASDSRFQCPKHKSRYHPDGKFISGRATRGMDRFGISRSANSVVVDLDALYQEDDNPTEWAAAVIKL